jgi:hypothetical protein
VIWLPIPEMPVPNQSRRKGFEIRSGEMSTGRRRSQPEKPGRSASTVSGSSGRSGSLSA